MGKGRTSVRPGALLEHRVELYCKIGADGAFQEIGPGWEDALGHNPDTLKRKLLKDIIHRSGRHFVDELRRAQKPLRFTARCKCADGTYKRFLWYAFPADEGSYFVLGQEEQSKQGPVKVREMQQRLDQTEGLVEAALSMNSALSFSEVVQLITQRARTALNAHLAVSVVLLENNWDDACFVYSLSDKYAQYQGLMEKSEYRPVHDFLVAGGQSVVLGAEELANHPVLRQVAKATEHHPAMQGFAGVPLFSRHGRSQGFIHVSEKVSGDFTREDEQLLTKFASILSAAVELRTSEAEIGGKVGPGGAGESESEGWDDRTQTRGRQSWEARARELRRSNRELEQFAYAASHDLQEPLRMVSSYLGLLERRYKDALDDDAREFIGYAVDGASRMKALINDLLTYARVGTQKLDMKPVSAERLVRQTMANLAVPIEETEAEITYDPLPTIVAEENQLIYVFQNLISNAIKFRGDRRPRIHISASRRGGAWVFSVQDNGRGIEPQYFDRIFMMFKRLDPNLCPGTGVGLALCWRIVEQHGGHIWVESTSGEGSTFYFSIPTDSHTKPEEPYDQ